MWGQSFADLAKKAAELQEQAASSMATTSTTFPSIGGAGGLFNLDYLQEDNNKEQPSKPPESGAKLSNAVKTPSRAVASSSGNYNNSTTATANSIYNTMSSMYNTPSPSSKTSIDASSTVTQSSTATKSPILPISQPFPTKTASDTSVRARKPPSTTSSNINSNNAVRSMSLISGGIKAPASLPKGKLSVPSSSKTKTFKLEKPPPPPAVATPFKSKDTKGMTVSTPALTETPEQPTETNDKQEASGINGEPQQNGNLEKRNEDLDGIDDSPASEPTILVTQGNQQPPKDGPPPSSTIATDTASTARAVLEEELIPMHVSEHCSTSDKVVDSDALQAYENFSSLSTDPSPAIHAKEAIVTKENHPVKELLIDAPGDTRNSVSDNSINISPPIATEEMFVAEELSAETPVKQIHETQATTPQATISATLSEEESNDKEASDDVHVAISVPRPLRMNHDNVDGKNDDNTNSDRGETTRFQNVSQEVSSSVPEETNPPKQSTNGHTIRHDHHDDQDKQKREQHLQQQFTNQLQRLEENHQAEQAAKQAEFETTMADLQRQLQEQEYQFQHQSQNWNRQQEESSKQLEIIQRELSKAKELLADKEREDRRLQEAHLKQLRDMEKQFFKSEDTNKEFQKQIYDLEQSLEASKIDMEKSQEEYKTMKERAKNVAGELKERRIECRTLATELDLVKAKNTDLEDRISQLEAAGMDMNQSSIEIQEELNSLRSQLAKKGKELDVAQKAIEEERKKGEDALGAYKKKAQQSLALANSRAASAMQSKEEAELEARAARTTADSAMQRAIEAESKGKQALVEAKKYVAEMETEVAKYNKVKEMLEKTTVDLNAANSEAKNYQELNEKLQCELTSSLGRLEAEHATTQDLKQSLSEAQTRSNELYDEVERLRREHQRSQDEIRRLSEARNTDDKAEPKVIIQHAPNEEAEATIAMLKQELQDANQAIRDLKETLKVTMEEKDGAEPQPSGGMNGHADSGMALFYAMEKQAELTQAREEITRLASLLGDAESTKQEALDAADEMKTMMEDAQARLKRQEQLKKSPEVEKINLEYLKNIVLSYLNSTSIEEKKMLLPVIGTVLCLTDEERRKAMDALDKGAPSVVDSVANTVLNLTWR